MTNVTQGSMLLVVIFSSTLALYKLQYSLKINMDPSSQVGNKGKQQLHYRKYYSSGVLRCMLYV